MIVNSLTRELLLAALAELGVDGTGRRGYLQAHLARLPGWSAHVRWRGDQGDGINLVDYLAMRLAYEALLLRAAGPADPPMAEEAELPTSPTAAERAATVVTALSAADADAGVLAEVAQVLEQVPVAERAFVWLDAYEAHYRDPLLAARPVASSRSVGAAQRPGGVRIDARSEGLRRHPEALGTTRPSVSPGSSRSPSLPGPGRGPGPPCARCCCSRATDPRASGPQGGGPRTGSVDAERWRRLRRFPRGKGRHGRPFARRGLRLAAGPLAAAGRCSPGPYGGCAPGWSSGRRPRPPC